MHLHIHNQTKKNDKRRRKMINLLNLNIMSIKDFAKAIKKTVSTIYEWRRDRKIPEECFKLVGKSIFVRVDKITEFFNA